MSRDIRGRFLAAALICTVTGSVQGSGPPGDLRVNEEYLSRVGQAARQMARDVERLQDAIVAGLSGEEKRALYRHTDSVLAEAEVFMEGLKPGGARKDVYERFDQMDAKLHKLLDALEELGEKDRSLQRAAEYVKAADSQLHFAISAGDVSQERVRQMIDRQAQALAQATRELERTATFALGGSPGREAILGDLRKLRKATESFQPHAAGKADRKTLQVAFTPIDLAWGSLVRNLKRLSPQENAFLLRAGIRLDQLHERLHRLLEIKGERSRLTIRT